MAKRSIALKVESDGSEKMLVEMVERFSVRRAVEWLRMKFTSFDTSRAEEVACDTTKNEKDYFVSAELLGYVTRLPLSKSDDANKPVLVAAIKMRKDLTERTSRLVQFNYSKKLLQNAIAKGAQGVSGLPSQGLFFFYDKDGFFRLSLVTGEVEKRRFKYNEAKRQSFYIEPQAANNIVKRRLTPPIKTFAELKDVFSVEQLTKEFYSKLFDWYTWAMSAEANVSFPNDLEDDKDDRKYNNEAIIRMITRLMFTWFIRQRKLVPDVLFDRDGLQEVLKNFEPDSMEQDNYYRAILQNLFFATFNCQPEKRSFIHTFQGKCDQRHVTTLYRYEKEFKNGDGSAFKAIMKSVPFLNCALFDCLDKIQRDVDGGHKLYFDGFSGEKGHAAHVPNGLFFDPERGIINLFNLYEFTVNENNADDSDVALDPELLGKVFENLLGAFNPETQETARNATGSFYTPREIVDYMVEESLRNYLKTKVPEADDARLDDLFDRNKAAEGADTLFSAKEREAILSALYGCKILDPACGSGAFPMGVLHCMVRLLTRLDPQCISIREHLLSRYRADKASIDPTETEDERRERLAELESRLKEGQHYPDYERKLYLIENCIYGVDIQPIATQISKLRFFISLLCDQLRSSYDPDAENFGLLSLPNLEAKFVCANTLISLPNLENELSYGEKVVELRVALQENRHKIFRARSTKTKDKYKRRDLEIRDAIRDTVRDSLSKPDELVIAKCREQIDDAKERRKKVAEPDWYEEDVQVQTELFSAFESKRVRKDRNEPERKKIDSEIEWAEKKIRDELAKADRANVSSAARYADMVAGWDPYDQNASSSFFDPEWMFNIKDGFDVVIGNPPYGVVNKRQNKSESIVVSDEVLSYYKESAQFKEARGRGLLNIYRLFVQKSFILLAQGGIFSEIFPLAFAGDLSAAELRKFIFSNYRILSFDAFPERDNPQRRVFEAAKISVCILIAQNLPPKDGIVIRINHDKFVDLRGEYCRLPSEILVKIDPGYMRLPIVESVAYNVFMKMRSNAMPLKSIARCKDGEMSMTSDKAAFTNNSSFPEMLRGAGIGRFIVHKKLSQGERLYIDEDKIDDLENVRKLKRQKRIALQAITGVNEKWRIKGTIVFDVYCANSVNYIRGLPNMEFTLGLLNSRLLNFFFAKFSTNSNVNGYEIDELPLVLNTTHEQEEKVIVLVDRILAAKKADPAADTSALEAEIDQLVYKLYGLTDEEIAVVEGRDESKVKSEEPRTVRTSTNRRNAPVTVTPTDDEELE